MDVLKSHFVVRRNALPTEAPVEEKTLPKQPVWGAAKAAT